MVQGISRAFSMLVVKTTSLSKGQGSVRTTTQKPAATSVKQKQRDLPFTSKLSTTERRPPVNLETESCLGWSARSGKPVDFEDPTRYSLEGKARVPDALTAVASSFGESADVISMHGGLPRPSAFPFASLSATLKDGTVLLVDDSVKVAEAQQYNTQVNGYPLLQQWAAKHVQKMHAPPTEHTVIISNGTNHTIEMVTSLLLDRGDAILCEEFTYFYLLDSVAPTRGYRAVPVRVDRHGMVPGALRQVLRDMRQAGQPLPRCLYTVPVGQNPTGVTTKAARKAELYAICSEHDIIILEDDAYYYLQFAAESGHPQPRGLACLGRSYLSLDTDGRVVRMDSFSKLLAPGLRLGWAAAPPPLARRMAQHLHASLNGPCGVTQVLVADLLQTWGQAGFDAYVAQTQAEYRRRAAVLHACSTEELKGLAQWEVPSAGMFLWLRLLGVPDAGDAVDRLRRARVGVLPGRICWAGAARGGTAGCPFVRLSYASATDAEMRRGVQLLGQVLRSL